MTMIIAGAGLSGLSCALALADAGHEVELHEAAPQAGGRCRSWFDARMEAVIDNGTHLIAGGNHQVWSYLRRIGSEQSLEPLPAALPMMDLQTGRRWTASALPLLPTILAALPRLACNDQTTVVQALGRSARYRDFWHPLALAVLNTDPDLAQAKLLRRVLARTLWRGGSASRLYQAKAGLSPSFIDPAITALQKMGVQIRFGHPLRAVTRNSDGKAHELRFDDETRRLSRHDRLILALPLAAARRLLPGLPELPHSAIANLCFKLTVAQAYQFSPRPLGLIGGMAQWVFIRDNILSITLSAAPQITEQSVGALWRDVCRAYGLSMKMPEYRLIQEKRATLLHIPETEQLRRSPQLNENIFLCGDVTSTSLPCTIEGAIQSGRQSAALMTVR